MPMDASCNWSISNGSNVIRPNSVYATGVELTTAFVLLALGTLDNKKIAALVGVDPISNLIVKLLGKLYLNVVMINQRKRNYVTCLKYSFQWISFILLLVNIGDNICREGSKCISRRS